MDFISKISRWTCNKLAWFCPDPQPTYTNVQRLSADGQSLKKGDSVFVLSKSTIGANYAADYLTATSSSCPNPNQMNFANDIGNVCIDTALVYANSSVALQAVTEGRAKMLPTALSIHVSD